MVHVIQLALGAVMSSLSVKADTKSWEAHEHDQQYGENDSTDIGKSQRLRKEGNARINKAHQQKIITSAWDGSVRVDAVRQGRQRHPGGCLLCAQR